MALNDESENFRHPMFDFMMSTPGLSVATASVDRLLRWGLSNSLWIFPMATSCCGIEFMAAAASRVDIDRMGSIVRATPRQTDVMIVAGTITVKMAPRVRSLWDQMPEPKWCLAMGSCAISGDFYRDLYPVVPGVDTLLPVDVYVPGCPPNPEALMHGLLRLQELVRGRRNEASEPAVRPETAKMIRPSVARVRDPERAASISLAQLAATQALREDHSLDPRTALAIPRTTRDPESPPEAAPPGQDAAEILSSRFGVTEMPADGPAYVPAARHREFARVLAASGYKQLVFVVASHWPERRGKEPDAKVDPEHFDVAFGVRTVGRASRLAQWRVRVEADATIDTLADLFPGADWQEREQYDLVGVRFAGHPDLRRIVTSTSVEAHPLRRDRASNAACPPWR